MTQGKLAGALLPGRLSDGGQREKRILRAGYRNANQTRPIPKATAPRRSVQHCAALRIIPSIILAVAFSQSERTGFESGRQARALLGKGAALIARATDESSTLRQ